ncbi:redoxin domain-containing protein [Tautonia plasticadhaerens]|uniref:AhpC/TSA family protein n=1 Tax=Tautonia plasticadhaerens TaxID=2527974 RepID=A0A518H1Z2_9BACT|nr:redoxin domain-containing protein [Tautonia plasticadhaerens]QDV34845.1 AhpC/TSA family protein [Tautonia plasticadhaerens]
MIADMFFLNAFLAGSLLFGGAGEGGEWPSLPSPDGHAYRISDFEESRLVVLVFTGNTCPIAADYDARLNALAGRFDPRQVRFVAVNVADGPGESIEDMKDRAGSGGLLYLKDEAKALARKFDARVTPHAFVLAERGSRVVYQGAIDDNPADAAKVRRPFLEQAIRAALEGKSPAVSRTTPKGCSILY